MGFFKTQLIIFSFFAFLGAIFFFTTNAKADWIIDTTPPTITATAPPPNSNNMYENSVAITFTCNDAATGASDCYSINTTVQFYSDSALTNENVGAKITQTICDDPANPTQGKLLSGATCPVSSSQTFSYVQTVTHILGYRYVKITYNATDGVGNTSTDAIFNSSGINPTATTAPGPGTPTPTPGPICQFNCIILTPTLFTLTGRLYNDLNKNLVYDAATDTLYNTASTVSAFYGNACSGTQPFPQIATPPNPYSSGRFMEDQTIYSILFNTTLPAGYSYETPTCVTITINGANVTVDFGLSNLNPWWQCLGGDCRVDNGIVNKLPSGQFAAVNSTQSINPGVIFTGNALPDFGAGTVSSTGYLVGGTTYPETFTKVNGNIRTSYNSLYATAKGSGITPVNITTLPGCATLSNCSPTAGSIANGIYIANGNLTFNGYNFDAQNDSSLKLYFKMDEGSWNGTSGEVIDSSGNGNNGTSHNGATTTTGRWNNAGSFDGINDYVGTMNLGVLSAFTVSFWFNPTVIEPLAGPSRTLMSATQLNLFLHNWGVAPKQTVRDTGWGSQNNNWLTTFAANNWYHIAYVYKGGNIPADLLYENGVLQTRVFPVADNYSSPATRTLNSFVLAAAATGMTGKFDEVRVFNRALSGSEISNLYQYNTLLKNYVFLVNGNLTLNGNITTTKNATATFSSSGDIHVANTVGGLPTNTTTQLQGLFSADKNFILDSVSPSPCTGSDLRINFAGSVIANAAGSGGNFINNRDLCGNDTQYPTFTFTERPDFYMYAPTFIRHKNALYQEFAP